MPSYALNFYSPIVEAQLRSHRKTATIRLGDKSRKYQKGMIVAVLVGARYGPRQHVFDAVIDKVEVKRLAELSPREIEHDNPEIRRPEEMAHFLGQLYNRDVTEDDIVTVIRFSAIRRTATTGSAGRLDARTIRCASVPTGRRPARRLTRAATPADARGAAAELPPRGSASRRAPARAAAPRTPRSRPRTSTRTARRTRAAVQHLAAAGGAPGGHLVLELLEPAPRGAAVEADRGPVAEHLPALLAQPVRRLPHPADSMPTGRAGRGRYHADGSPTTFEGRQWRSHA